MSMSTPGAAIPSSNGLLCLNRAVFWFHPAAWWLERHLSALAEEACDNVVLARGYNPRDYSEYLIDMARSVMRSGARLNVVGMAMPGSFSAAAYPANTSKAARCRVFRARGWRALPSFVRLRARCLPPARWCAPGRLLPSSPLSTDHQPGVRGRY